MITTKRQIRTNDDRYIGSADDATGMNTLYGDIRSHQAVDNGNDDRRADFADIRISEEPVRETHEAYDFSSLRPVEKMPIIESKKAVEEKPLYSTRETLGTELPPRPVKKNITRGVEDVMPSLKTLNAAEHRADVAVAPADNAVAVERAASRPRAFTNLSPRMKVVLLISLAIALVLAIAVIATGVSISHASAESAALARDISAKQEIIADQQATIADLTSDSTLRDEALLHGMVSAGDPEYSATRAEKSDYPEATPHTNPFDSFCDWLGGVIN